VASSAPAAAGQLLFAAARHALLIGREGWVSALWGIAALALFALPLSLSFKPRERDLKLHRRRRSSLPTGRCATTASGWSRRASASAAFTWRFLSIHMPA
jgi:hypothetical protein